MSHAASVPHELLESEAPGSVQNSAPDPLPNSEIDVPELIAPEADAYTSNEDTRQRRRLLLVTPYSPLAWHGHAADDLGRRLVDSLSRYYDLHVYAPGQQNKSVDDGVASRVTYHRGAEPSPSFLRHFGIFPAGLRKDWSRKNTRELGRLLKLKNPDLVHVEYLQPVEAFTGRGKQPWTVTLHDITSVVFRQRALRSVGLNRIYRWLEFVRVEAVEKRAVRRASRVLALSERDVLWVRATVPTQSVAQVRIGMSTPTESWSAATCQPATFVFAGAMWRDSNIAAAIHVAQEVMPRVWEVLPDAVLKIVGASPSRAVLDLAEDSRIKVTGKVESIEEEYLNATAVLAPTLVDAGILLKALRALACGAPLVVNRAAAEPLSVEDGVHCYVRDEPADVALELINIVKDPTSASIVAARGKTFMETEFSQERYGQDMIQGIGE